MECAYKYRIYPNKEQKQLIHKTFGCTRFIYNYFLDLRIKKYDEEKITLSYNSMSKELTSLKRELIWLKEPDKDSLQKALKDLDNACKNFFKEGAGFPRFKSKRNNHKSYRTNCTNNNIRYEEKHIRLPKLGFVKIRDKQIPNGRILNATISQDSDGKYYCSLCCTNVELIEFSKTNKNVGIDVGLLEFAIFSDGLRVENNSFYENSEDKLAKLQRELSRKTKGSSNWNKVRLKLAKLQKHISNQRKDFLNKLTTKIVKNYDIISIEDLKVSDMKETDNTIRNKRVSDVSWYEFRRQLTYKTIWYGKVLSVVDRYYPSTQLCNVCGNNGGKKSENIRLWKCIYCNSELERDLNSAMNICNEGIRLLSNK